MERTQPVRPRPRSPRVLLLIPVVLLVVVAVAAVTGYQSGVEQAQTERAQRISQANLEQFNLGVEDLLAGRYAIARQRFEYILSLDPNYPGAADLLASAMQALNVPTSTPSLTPVPATPSPTLDVSSLDGLFGQAQAAFSQSDWSGALRALLAMRATDASYRLSEVNTLMAAALRNRGLEKILQGFLEPGIYDLALAERFGPLDSQALSWRYTAEFYLNANSYIGLDWPQAATYFAQLCASGTWDSCAKYALSAMRYGDLLVTPDPCGAVVQYDASLRTFFDAVLAPTATQAANFCLTATASTPTLTPTGVTPTPTPTVGLPTPGTPSDTPTLTETPTETPTPSETPG